MKRFQLFLLKKLAKKTSLEPETGCLSVEELQQATMYVIRYAQDDVFEAVKARLTDFEEYPCRHQRKVLDRKRQFVGSTLLEGMQAVSMLQAASLQTADGTFTKMPRYLRQARFHLYRSRLLRAYSC